MPADSQQPNDTPIRHLGGEPLAPWCPWPVFSVEATRAIYRCAHECAAERRDLNADYNELKRIVDESIAKYADLVSFVYKHVWTLRCKDDLFDPGNFAEDRFVKYDDLLADFRVSPEDAKLIPGLISRLLGGDPGMITSPLLHLLFQVSVREWQRQMHGSLTVVGPDTGRRTKPATDYSSSVGYQQMIEELSNASEPRRIARWQSTEVPGTLVFVLHCFVSGVLRRASESDNAFETVASVLFVKDPEVATRLRGRLRGDGLTAGKVTVLAYDQVAHIVSRETIGRLPKRFHEEYPDPPIVFRVSPRTIRETLAGFPLRKSIPEAHYNGIVKQLEERGLRDLAEYVPLPFDRAGLPHPSPGPSTSGSPSR